MAYVSTTNNTTTTVSNKTKTVEKSRIETINYEAIDQMESFNTFVKKKKKFLFGITASFLTFYIFLPILAFTPVLQQKWVGNITGVWVYSAALFIMTVILCTVYVRMAPKFDKMAADVLAEYEKEVLKR